MLNMFLLDSVLEAPSEHVDDGDAYTPLEVDTSQQIQDATDKMMAEPPATSNTNVNTITSTRYIQFSCNLN